MEKVEIAPWASDRDRFDIATELINEAYALHNDQGIRFGAATQSLKVTRRRIETATATWVARMGQIIVGVISYYDHVRYPRAEPKWYAHTSVGHFGQFAVAPWKQRLGIGRSLLSHVEDRAVADRMSELCCDTASTAMELLLFYKRLGFEEVDRHQWQRQDYESIVLSKRLGLREIGSQQSLT
ncbi:MAG TPA: GNAT family N-acetyltransferase [Candidatus Tumulicola sp.]|jgi:ribosomal protein S18 acetylase RimI-like enzyme